MPRDNGSIWDLMPTEEARGFLWQKEFGPEHPARAVVYEWLEKQVLELETKPTLLDVPCGAGVDYKVLSSLCGYTGMDKTHSIVQAMKKNYPEADILQGDIREIPAKDESYDYVHARAIFEHLCDLEDTKTAMKECYRVAKKGCIFAFFLPLGAEENIRWNGAYYNNIYKKSDVEEVIKSLGAKTVQHQFVAVDNKSFIDSYDIFFLEK